MTFDGRIRRTLASGALRFGSYEPGHEVYYERLFPHRLRGGECCAPTSSYTEAQGRVGVELVAESARRSFTVPTASEDLFVASVQRCDAQGSIVKQQRLLVYSSTRASVVADLPWQQDWDLLGGVDLDWDGRDELLVQR